MFRGPAGLREVVFGWKIDVGRRLDDLIVPKAVRWNSPRYGIEGEGWFVSYHVFTRYVKVNFLNGTSLRPVPPSSGKDKDSRWNSTRSSWRSGPGKLLPCLAGVGFDIS